MSLNLEIPSTNERSWSVKVNGNFDKIDACLGRLKKVSGAYCIDKTNGELKLKVHPTLSFDASGKLSLASLSDGTLSNLQGVAITSVFNSQYFRYNSALGKWTNQTGSGASSFTSLAGVTVSSPADAQILRYNGSTWSNATATQQQLASLSDVSMTTLASKQILHYNSSTSKWTNSALIISLHYPAFNGILATNTNRIASYNTSWRNNTFYNVRGVSTPAENGILTGGGVNLNCRDSIIVPEVGPVEFKYGIKFNNATEVLSRFEEGEFTPELRGGSTTALSESDYSVRIGKYSVLGKACTVNVYLEWDSTTAPSGELRVYGLPFVSDSTSQLCGAGDCILEGISYPQRIPFANIIPNSSYILVSHSPTHIGGNISLPASGKMWISLNYTTQ